MKLKLHSQSQSRDWILHRSASNSGKKPRLVTFLPLPLHVPLRSWPISPCRMCAQYFQMVINPLSGCKELGGKLLISPTDTLQLLSATPKSFFQSLFISLHLFLSHSLCLLVSLNLFVFVSLSVCSGLDLQHATCGHASLGFEVCLLCMFVCRTPKLPLWSATFGIWRMRSKC